jgi:Na+/melibiose symporter-like transporter
MQSLARRRSRIALYYGLCAMAVSMLHSVFSSFYVDFFVRQRLQPDVRDESTARTSLVYFATGQLAYALWNGINDLGFGWLGDTKYASQSRRRLGRILVGGPLWAFVFALMWMPIDVPFLHPAVQFSLMMIFYDGFFSYTSVAFRALLTDISHSPSDREVCNMYAAFFHVLGSLGVFAASYLYETRKYVGHAKEASSLLGFRVFTTIWAGLAAVAFVVSSRAGHEAVLVTHEKSVLELEGPEAGDASLSSSSSSTSSLQLRGRRFLRFARETCSRSSMVATMIVWCVQEYSCTFATNFFSLFLALAAHKYISPAVRSALLLASFLIPHVVTISLTPFYSSVGKKKIIAGLFVSRAAVGGAVILLWYYVCYVGSDGGGVAAETASLPGEERRGAVVVFSGLLLLNRVLTEAVCRLQSLVISDVCDEDTAVFKREASHAAAIHGLVSVVSKPFQSLAPVVTCYVLAASGVDFGQDDASPEAVAVLRSVTLLLGVTTVVTSCVMLLPWLTLYTLEGKRLLTIQHQVQKRSAELCSLDV